MFKKIFKLNDTIHKLQDPVEYDMEPYKKLVEEIDNMDLEALSDFMLREKSARLRERAQKGAAADELLVEAFALAREAAWRVLGMRPFAVQLIAGIVLHRSKMAEMQTGEGKTLAAVLPAYLNALTGKGVHVLTFNDYLAQRDAEWMGPVYKFLGLTVAYVREGMSNSERQRAYTCDITYVTAKEAGFDYLRDFLCTEKENLVHKAFHYAIVDEADSILIDEARIPLVIAGEVSEEEKSSISISDIVKKLKQGRHYDIDQNGRNIYLTDEGILRAEELLGCGNLYAPENLEQLTGINCSLHAEILLEKNKDYIVRNGKIEIVDEFTGRIADKRHWPDNLQVAVEAKEGLASKSKGIIMGSLALQYFLSLYPRLSGMTGTARKAAEELREFYCMEVVVIPTNKPCIRKDYSDSIFTHTEAKQRAIVSEVKRAHETGQPILIGTGSVEESEGLAEELQRAGITCQVLNAKNDEMEARIIAKAGELCAVTVSTNMAGRGVDIKLGGEDKREREKIAALGGLYVIGTNHHESHRIDDQLRGRAGRQGDAGESRFIVSLEDDLIRSYELTKLIPPRRLPVRQEGCIEDSIVSRELERGQRIVEGYNSDIRRQLWKYTYIVEQQRRIIHQKRQSILQESESIGLLEGAAPEHYHVLCEQVGEAVLKKVEKQLLLYYINKCWADYLDYIAYIRESIHLVVIGKKDPLNEFHKLAIEGFDEMLEEIEAETVRSFEAATITAEGIEMDKEGLKGPSSTWTYLINDNPAQFSNLPFLLKAFSTIASAPLFSLRSLLERISGRKKRV